MWHLPVSRLPPLFLQWHHVQHALVGCTGMDCDLRRHPRPRQLREALPASAARHSTAVTAAHSAAVTAVHTAFVLGVLDPAVMFPICLTLQARVQGSASCALRLCLSWLTLSQWLVPTL